MNYLSVCSGIEAATVAWHDMGWKAVGYSEIEKFPSEVLHHHYPNVSNFGDMTKYKDWNINESVELLVGGTPCQSFSVAGLRKGLEDPRGNLALTYVGILDKFRPKWCVWENVPGVLSSGKGRDFGSFLGALVELGYGFAYRVLDAQHFGVAQRRRRVFVVGYLGDWKPAAKVLFESESLRRDIKKSKSKGKETPGYVADSVGTLLARDYKGIDSFDHSKMIAYVADKAPTLTSSAAGISRVGNDMTADSQYIACALSSGKESIGTLAASQGQKQFLGNQEAFSGDYHVVSMQGNLIGRDKGGPNGVGVSKENVMYTLTKTDVHGVAYGFEPGITKREGEPNRFVKEMTPTLRAQMGDNQIAMINQYAVRRLTPIECERLQGFPDNYTDIKLKGKNTPDGPRYKALGNSMAVPVMKWIGQRINEVNKSL
jgi:DNA (cytosine-5)-methyltransferase 1